MPSSTYQRGSVALASAVPSAASASARKAYWSAAGTAFVVFAIDHTRPSASAPVYEPRTAAVVPVSITPEASAANTASARSLPSASLEEERSVISSPGIRPSMRATNGSAHCTRVTGTAPCANVM
jgi:hypothetical protein